MPVVEDLYAAFEGVPHPVDLEGCPCCVDPEEGLPLLARPLRDLTGADLRRYAAKVLNTWGRDRLRRLHEQIRADGVFVPHSSRFLIEARQPG